MRWSATTIPSNMEQIGEQEFHRIHAVLQRFYRVVVIDTGNNVRSPNWQAAVNAADVVVIPSTYQRDVGFSASWVLDHLIQTGREELAEHAVTVLTAADPSHRPEGARGVAAPLRRPYPERRRDPVRPAHRDRRPDPLGPAGRQPPAGRWVQAAAYVVHVADRNATSLSANSASCTSRERRGRDTANADTSSVSPRAAGSTPAARSTDSAAAARAGPRRQRRAQHLAALGECLVDDGEHIGSRDAVGHRRRIERRVRRTSPDSTFGTGQKTARGTAADAFGRWRTTRP